MPQRPAKLRADILHKNSFYYNQPLHPAEAENTYLPKSVSEHCCGWKECRAKFLSSNDLLKHVQDDHLSYLPSNEYQCQRKLTCQWRKCLDNRSYPARYKLLLHLQRYHCNDKKVGKQEHSSSQSLWIKDTFPAIKLFSFGSCNPVGKLAFGDAISFPCPFLEGPLSGVNSKYTRTYKR